MSTVNTVNTVNTVAVPESKQPFLPETRLFGNQCACASCGALERATENTRPAGALHPQNWEIRTVQGKQLYACARCANRRDLKSADRFYNAHDATWNVAKRIWEFTSTTPTTKKHTKKRAA